LGSRGLTGPRVLFYAAAFDLHAPIRRVEHERQCGPRRIGKCDIPILRAGSIPAQSIQLCANGGHLRMGELELIQVEADILHVVDGAFASGPVDHGRQASTGFCLAILAMKEVPSQITARYLKQLVLR